MKGFVSMDSLPLLFDVRWNTLHSIPLVPPVVGFDLRGLLVRSFFFLYFDIARHSLSPVNYPSLSGAKLNVNARISLVLCLFPEFFSARVLRYAP